MQMNLKKLNILTGKHLLTKKKVEISLKGQIIDTGIIDCQSILSAEKIDGKLIGESETKANNTYERMGGSLSRNFGGDWKVRHN